MLYRWRANPAVRPRAVWVVVGVGLVGALAAARAARADPLNVAAGTDYTLPADLTLAGAESFHAGDDAGAPCHIHGAGHGVASAAGWTGSFDLHNCVVDGLGRADLFAIELHAVGATAIAITGNTFSASAAIELGLADQSSINFRGNTIAEDSLVPAVEALMDSAPVFHAQGFSTGAKLFQGNLIKKSRLHFQSTSGWTVGGEHAGDGNVLVGTRAGMDLENASDMLVEGNYSHTTIPMLGWNQVKNITLGNGGGNVRVLHNVFWGFNWSTSIDTTGELAYNLIVDNIERGYGEIWNQAGARIHHNLLVATRDNQTSPHGGYVIESHFTNGAPYSTEIYNNTFDAGGVCVPAIESGVLIKGGVLGSLRSNVFAEIRIPAGSKAIVHSDSPPDAGLLALLGYSDYNLFYAPDSPVQTPYGVTVVGKAAGEPGAGMHDVLVPGQQGQPDDVPLFAEKIPRRFAFDEAGVVARTTSVCQILAHYRRVYTPAAGSALIGGGDPADGAGNFIGAIGTDAGGPGDLFGRASFCDASDVGTPDTSPAIYTCPPVDPGGDRETVNPKHGFQCLCETGAASGAGGPWAPLGVAGGVLVLGLMACRGRGRARAIRGGAHRPRA